jgi:3-hydroxyisobutyrate dehydrogenase-like beta-hydroxyacid dehydrogenase
MTTKIGFIGLGNMGAPMAQHLLKPEYELVVYDMSQAVRNEWAAKGCTAAASVKDVANKAATVFLSLPTPDVVETVVLGDDGVASGSEVSRIVDLSTTGPATSRRIGQGLEATGKVLIDSPISGGVAGAVAGTVAVMASCSEHDLDAVAPMLRCIGKLFHVGVEPGQGQIMKLINNLLSASALALTSEAVVMGVKSGLQPDTMIDVINAGSGRNSATQDKYPKSILPRKFNAGFASKLMYKDVRLCVEHAESMGLAMTGANAIRELWARAVEEIGPDEDFTTIVKLFEREADVTVAGREAAAE